MSCPMGMELNDDECLEMRKGMHNLHQSSWVYWLVVIKFLTLEEVGFEQSKANQWLFVKMTKNGPLTLLLCVNDSTVIGHRSDINDFFDLAGKRFKVKTEGKLNDFQGYNTLREEGK